jgi:cysteine-rich repeat protein
MEYRMDNLAYRSAALAVSLALAACGDDGIATTEQGSSSGTGTTSVDSTTGDPTDPTTPTSSTTTPTSTTIDPPTTSTTTPGTVTDTETTVDPTTGPSTETDPTTGSTGDTTTGSTGDTTTGSTGDTDTDTGGGVCGDGVLDEGEVCDDGENNGDNNACKLDCTAAQCGDGLLGPDEVCDDGDQNGDNKACKLDCTPNVCGDGALGPGEDCDDGADNGDNNACKLDCTANVCGDGLVGPGEGCDDGNNVDNDTCTNACALASCGDGIPSVSEECDDGNMDDTDVCTNACTNASCGDAIIQPINGEACDDGANNGDQADCTGLCNVAACGDGLVHNLGSGTEECDNGDDNGPGKACNNQCILNVCGDGDQGPEEACDDGDLESGDGCNAICQLEVCGDNKVDPGEQCDDGKDGDQDDGCTDLCTTPACGDGFEQPSIGEGCDLGGENSDTGACTLSCQDAVCGDAKVQAGVEQCDDGAANNGDTKACKTDCTDNFCGDGFVEAGVEECDDGNANDHDACSNVCKAAACNDGVKNGQETDVDCGGPSCNICPTVLLLAGGNLGPNGLLGGQFTTAQGWITTPLAGVVNVANTGSTDITMTTAGLGVGVVRYTQLNDPQDNQLKYVTWNKGTWSAVQQVNADTTSGWPSIDSASDTAHLAFRGSDAKHYYTSFANGAWTVTEQIPMASGAVPGDLIALADNLVFMYRNPDVNLQQMLFINRTGGVWGVPTFLSGTATTVTPPNMIPLSAGPEILGIWHKTGNMTLRGARRSGGVWPMVGFDVPAAVTTTVRPGLAPLSFGAAILVYRNSADNKLYGVGYLPNNTWTASVEIGAGMTISGSPAVAQGPNPMSAEVAFISGGKVWHEHLTIDLQLNLMLTPPVQIGGDGILSVSLTRSK